MTEIRFEEKEQDQPPYMSRILVYGERMRMDFGADTDDFILFDRREKTAWHVAREARRMIGILAETPRYDWPQGWKLSRDAMPSGTHSLSQVRVNDSLCVEYKTAPMLKAETALIRDFRKALAGNHARTWDVTPDDLRHPCILALDVRVAGVEYQEGFPLAARYWDGRVRVYQSHQALPARPELFKLPADFNRVLLGAGDQEKGRARQPKASQRK